MNKVTKKGFTLIELIAVIVILAVIALISVPVITEIIKDTKKQAFNSSAQNIVKSAKNAYVSNKVSDEKIEPLAFEYKDGKIIEGTTDLNYDGERPESGVIFIDEDGQIGIAIKNGDWCAKKDYDKSKVTIMEYAKDTCVITKHFEYTGDYQTYNVSKTGMYQIELWGASGYGNTGGKGSYTQGIIKLDVGDQLNVYVGKAGTNVNLSSILAFNGGGGGSNTCLTSYVTYGINWQGGGATDIRLLPGDWNNLESLRSRIMVSGGGGGMGWQQIQGGNGGD